MRGYRTISLTLLVSTLLVCCQGCGLTACQPDEDCVNSICVCRLGNTCIDGPLLSQTAASWIVQLEGIPSSQTSTLHVATLEARSNRILTFAVDTISTLPSLSASDVGVTVVDNEVHVSWLLVKYRYSIAFPITGAIRVTDNGNICRSPNGASPGPCSSIVLFTLDLLSEFNPPCPRDIYAYTAQPSTIVTWTPPRVFTVSNYTQFTMKSPLAPGVEVVLGNVVVVYQPGMLLDQSQTVVSTPSCSFTIHVLRGVGAVVETVGHVYHVDNITSAASIRDYCLDASLIYGGSRVPVISTWLGANISTTLAVSARAGFTFTLEPPPLHTTSMIIDLQYCSNGLFPASTSSSQLYNLTTSVQLTNILSSTSATLTLDGQSDSTLLSDGRCFRLKYRVAPSAFDTALEFGGISVTFSVTSGLLTPLPLTTYFPVRNGAGLYFEYAPTALSPGAAVDPGPRLFVDDRQPPEILFCPSDIYIKLSPGVVSQRVAWTEPVARDNVQVASFIASAESGTTYTIFQTPMTISYVAIDVAGLSTECKFQITLDYDRIEVTTTIPLTNDPFGLQGTQDTSGVNEAFDYLLLTDGTDSPVTLTVPTLLPTDFTFLTIGDQSQLYSLRTTHGGTRPQLSCLEVDLRFSSSPSPSNAYNPDMALLNSSSCAASFVNATTLQGTALNLPTVFETSQCMFIEGGFLRVFISTCQLPESFRFSGLRLSVMAPGNAASTVTNYSLILEPGSYIRFAYYDTRTSAQATPLSAERLLVYDNNAPMFLICPTDASFIAETGLDNAVVQWSPPIATDDRGFVYVETNVSNGQSLTIGSHVVHYIASDKYGNQATCRFAVSILDNEAPQLRCPLDQLVNITADGQVVTNSTGFWDHVTATDNSGVVNLIFPPEYPITHYRAGETTITVQALDPSENSATCSFTIRVIDSQPPVFVGCPSNLQGLALSSDEGTTVDWMPPTSYDNIDNMPPITSASHEPNQTRFTVGATLVTYRATDTSGNVAMCTFSVTILSATTSTSTTGLSQGATIGVIVGSSVAALLILVLVLLVVRARRGSGHRPHDFASILKTLNDLALEDGPRSPREIQRGKVALLEELGAGNFGSVSKGILTEIAGHPGYLVAVKVLHECTDESSRAAIIQEAAIMAQFMHDRIVGLVGVVTIGSPLLVVMEYCEYGALNDYLESHELNDKVKYMLAADCAEGLAYLASLKFVHRDIAARNVLLDSEKRAKIADFGMSRETRGSKYYQSRGGQLPVRWTAPEALESMKFTSASDCWSFGILLHEIWTNAAMPYADMESNQKVWVNVASGYRMPCPERCPTRVHELMLACWHEDPQQRPPFRLLAETLRDWECPDQSERSQKRPPVLSKLSHTAINDGYLPVGLSSPELVQAPLKPATPPLLSEAEKSASLPPPPPPRTSVPSLLQSSSPSTNPPAGYSQFPHLTPQGPPPTYIPAPPANLDPPQSLYAPIQPRARPVITAPVPQDADPMIPSTPVWESTNAPEIDFTPIRTAPASNQSSIRLRSSNAEQDGDDYYMTVEHHFHLHNHDDANPSSTFVVKPETPNERQPRLDDPVQYEAPKLRPSRSSETSVESMMYAALEPRDAEARLALPSIHELLEVLPTGASPLAAPFVRANGSMILQDADEDVDTADDD